MKKIIKLMLKTFAKSIVFFLCRINAGRYFVDKLSNAILHKKKTIKHKDLEFIFYIPNRLNLFRINTFSTKEPETLEWIDTFDKKSVFWDIGANIGLYSCYAVKRADCQVYAFEPSIFNLELLGRNILLNQLTDRITVIPLPLTEELLENTLNMSTTEKGGSQSTFGQNYSYDGSVLIKKFDYKTIGISMDQAVNLLNLPQPDYIKIDVDGIEHLILKGGSKTLKNAKSLLIEVD